MRMTEEQYMTLVEKREAKADEDKDAKYLAAQAKQKANYDAMQGRIVAALKARIGKGEVQEEVSGLVHGRPRIRVDIFLPRSLVVIECDGWAYHKQRGAFIKDRARQNAIVASGYHMLRYTHKDAHADLEATIDQIERVHDIYKDIT